MKNIFIALSIIATVLLLATPSTNYNYLSNKYVDFKAKGILFSDLNNLPAYSKFELQTATILTFKGYDFDFETLKNETTLLLVFAKDHRKEKQKTVWELLDTIRIEQPLGANWEFHRKGECTNLKDKETQFVALCNTTNMERDTLKTIAAWKFDFENRRFLQIPNKDVLCISDEWCTD